ncbi:MAG: hypothetical protein CL927_10925 [Deltaproteobacteria bacterium]|nr:hypothetical protein [Deltaproteobacteria bacterium]HCH61248.1 hypothetical protein [Deltaproteobacteria bacterium]
MMLSLVAALASGWMSTAQAAEDDWDFELEGYYRVRGYRFNPMEDALKKEGSGSFLTHRLRIQPQLNFEDRAKFFMMADLLDNVVWGDNASLMPASVFTQDPSYTHMSGMEQDFFQRSTNSVMIKRAWMEFQLPVGVVKVGRQESNWGMGILSNDGNGFDDTFGENHFGSTFDRIIFATKPIALVQTILGRKPSDIPFFTAVGVDRLVEDPLHQHYGYTCSLENASGDRITNEMPEYNPDCDNIDQATNQAGMDGIHDEDHDYVDEARTASNRSDVWFGENTDDAWEMVYVAIYKGEDINMFGSTGDFTLGAYVIDRRHEETNSRVRIFDAYTQFLHRGIYLEGEVVNIRGQTSGLALPGTYDPASKLSNPLYKDVNIWGWAARAGYKRRAYQLMFDAGFSGGDENVADKNFTGRALHPDFNVGLLLYDEILARVTQRTWSTEAYALWSNGGVWNSTYIFPNVTIRPMDNWEIVGAYLLAWPHKPDGSRIRCQDSDGVQCEDPANESLAQELGYEFDLAVKHRFHEHILFSVESAYARVSNRVPLEDLGLRSDGKFFTLQTRIAYEF